MDLEGLVILASSAQVGLLNFVAGCREKENVENVGANADLKNDGVPRQGCDSLIFEK